MNERKSDPTEAFRGGAAGLEDDPRTGTEYERHAPDGAEPGGGQPNTGSTGEPGDARERENVVEGTAATSEIADPEAQANAERQGDGTPQPR